MAHCAFAGLSSGFVQAPQEMPGPRGRGGCRGEDRARLFDIFSTFRLCCWWGSGTGEEAFHIDVSLDGTTFWTVGRRPGRAGGLSAVQRDEPVQARHIRVIADHPDAGGQMALSELGAYAGS